MVLLRRVKSYSRRSSPSVECSQRSTLVGKKASDAGVTRRAITDPPATCNGHSVLSQEPYCDIPHVVTIEATFSDDISELRDPYVHDPNTKPRPMTLIPNANYLFCHNQKTHCLGHVNAIVCEDEDWPSDEEGEMTSKGTMPNARGLNLCGLGDCLISPIPLEQAENRRDDGTENVSSTRDMALTCSGSTYANSFSQENSHLREDVNHRDDCDPPVAD
jgi:hypothetical protein